MQHYALKEAGLCDMAEVVGAFDINTVANEVYSHNFSKVDVHARLIESVG
jgi:tRNA (cytosine38-C5)-methyltransferase